MIDIWHTLDPDRFTAWWQRVNPARVLHQVVHSASVTPDGRRFEFDEGGFNAAILPVFDHNGEMVDMCAFEPLSPSRWWLWRGDGVDLNLNAVAHARAFRKPLTVASNPMEWLLHDCAASMPLQRCCHLMGVARVQCDAGVYARIEGDIRAAYPVPAHAT
jgi:hypothetical protein